MTSALRAELHKHHSLCQTVITGEAGGEGLFGFFWSEDVEFPLKPHLDLSCSAPAVRNHCDFNDQRAERGSQGFVLGVSRDRSMYKANCAAEHLV